MPRVRGALPEPGGRGATEGDDRFHELTFSKRGDYGTTATSVNVAVFSVVELPEATARPT